MHLDRTDIGTLFAASDMHHLGGTAWGEKHMLAKRNQTKAKGFTLIELLVVVAIVGILAAIAIPQYAQYRARGFNARISSDARNAATSEEAYFVDNNAYSANCSALPGMSVSSGVTCTVTPKTCVGGVPGFTVKTTHPQATLTPCCWDSCPGSGGVNMLCGTGATC